MSHHLYNPYVLGDGSFTQGQYELTSRQSERDLWRAPHHHHPGSSFSSSEVSSSLGGTIPPQPESCMSEQSRAVSDKDIVSSVDFHIGRARERSRHQPEGQDVYMSSSPERDKCLSSGKELTSYPEFSTFQRHRLSDSDGSSLSLCPIYKTPIRENSSKISSTSASSSYLSSCDRQFYASDERQRDVQAIPGLGDDGDRVPDKTMSPNKSQRPKYTPEIAVNILQKFGLGKEDLEYLLSFPEDQITSDNLPLILREIRIQKEKRASTTDQSESVSELQRAPSSIDKPSKLIDYGHTGKYASVGDETGRASRVYSGGNGSELGSHRTSSSRKELQQKSPPEVKNSSSISSRYQMGSVSSLSSARSPTKQQQTQSNHFYKNLLTSFSVVNEDMNTRRTETDPGKFFALNEPEPGCHLKSKSKPSKSETHEEKPFSGRRETKRHEVAERMKGKRRRRSPQEKEEKHKQLKEKEKSKQHFQHQKAPEELGHQLPAFHMSQAFQPHYFPASHPVPPPYFIPGYVAPSPSPQVIPGALDFYPPPPSEQFVASGPTRDMINDYAATPPVMFPHVCTLCNIVCPTMRDWLPHQNTNHHLENCKLLRKRFPQWDGNADHFLGAPGNTANPCPSPSAQSWLYGHEKIQHERRSCSHSPRRYSRSRRRRETSNSSSRSRSHSPQWRLSGSKSSRGSHSLSYSPRQHQTRSRSRGSSCSSSPHRHHSSMSKMVKRSRSRSKCRSRRSRSPFSSHQSHLRGHERRSPCRRKDEKQFTPRRSWKRPSVSGRPTSQRRRSSSAEKLLKTSEIHAPSKPFYLDTAVETPEVPKKKSRSSSSSNKLSKVNTDHSGSEVEESPPPTMVKLTSVCRTLTHSKVLAAVQVFGKTTSVILYRSKEEANVHFEKEEDAAKLRICKNLHIEGVPVKIVAEKPAVVMKTPPTSTEEQMKPPQHKSAESFLSTPKTSESTSLGKIETTVSSSTADNKTRAVSETVSGDSAKPVEAAAPKPAAPAADGKQAFISEYSEDPGTSLTVGEMLDTYLHIQSLSCIEKKEKCLTQEFSLQSVLISNLPKYTDGLYKEEEVAKLLHPFGFQHGRDQIYGIPQKDLAIALMPSAKDLQMLLGRTWNGIHFKDNILCLRPLNTKLSMTWFGFYRSLMNLMHFKVTDNGERTVYIEGISLEETMELRKALRKVVSVRNFLPLLNKLYVEFQSAEDADQLGLSYSLNKKDCMHTVYRSSMSRGPRCKCASPLGSSPPFWITMKARPYLFPTVSSWWSNPTYLTANTIKEVEKASRRGAAKFHTVMLTGFPYGHYTHTGVAKLLWPFLSKEKRHTNVFILPLQKRAFVYFSNWSSCHDFIINHITNPLHFKGSAIHVHIVLQEMGFNSNEVTVYRNLMKWSNCEIPDPASLESRMLSIEISVVSVELIRMIMQSVASIASFVNYLPLANKIYIEMPSSSDVTQVLKNFNRSNLRAEFRQHVSHIERLKSTQSSLKTAEEASDHKSAETSSEVDPNALGQEIKIINEAKSPETDLKDETAQEANKSLDKERNQNGDDKKDKILDSFKDQADKVSPEECSETDASLKKESFTAAQMSKEDGIQFHTANESTDKDAAVQNAGLDKNRQSPKRNGSSGEQEEGKILSEDVDQIKESDQNVEDESNGCPAECAEIEDGVIQQDSHVVEDDASTSKQKSEVDTTHVVNNSDKSAEEDTADTNDNQTPKIREDRESITQEDEKGDLEESSNISEDAGQISNDTKQPLKDRNRKDASEVLNEQEALETLDSVNDLNIRGDDSLKLETDQISKADVGSTDEDKDMCQADSVEDQLLTTDTESVAVNKEESTKKDDATPERDVRPSRRSGLRSRTCKSEEESPKKQDRADEQGARTKHITGKDKQTNEDTEETVSEVAYSIQDKSVQEIPTTKRSGRRRTTRGTNPETTCTILDSVEDEAASNEPAIMTRATRGGREKLKDAEEKSGKAETPTRKKNTPAREKTTKREDKALLRDTSGEEAVEDVQPATQVKPRRGRPKKDVKTSKKQSEAKEDLSNKEETLLHLANKREAGHDGLSAAERHVNEEKEKTLKTDAQKVDKPGNESRSDAEMKKTKEKSDSEMRLNVNKTSSAEKDEENEDEAGKTSISAKRKHDDSTEEKTSFMMVDEAVPTRKRGRPRKKTRNTPVRKSARGKTVNTENEREDENEPPPPDSLNSSLTLTKDTITLSNDVQLEIQRTDEEAANQSDVSAASAGQQLQPETLVGCEKEEEEGCSSEDVEGL
ncbi:uncharacterized protein LOC121639502 isoform X2 [Melanotaenia boesemani]|uniref:uncharacterized protein LOC121639502 isoform X2 n=1 Tax=Melanotaenia boesemani TaxID=1250792 RepID=UPI001C05748A|nr:uncharacterized protein LOC121639502 isoform X2 [Melanotaenia boesemani]